MKNSMKISLGLMVLLFALTGFCFGQQKSAGKKVNSNSEVVVEGKPLAEKKENSNSLWLVEGVPLKDKEPVKDEITIKRSRSMGFQNESKKSEVKITMTNEYNYLGISIRSKFIKGTVVVEIFDPKGDKQGSYTLKTEETVVLGDNTTSGEQVSGEFDKYFRLPINGEWIIRAVPTSATGTIELVLTQRYIKRTDTF